MTLLFDIESAPLPIEQVLSVSKTFEPPPHPGEFDPSSVKFGNLKDESKRSAKIDEARAAHAQSVTDYESNVESARQKWVQSLLDGAALSPTTGRVLAIGYFSPNTQKTGIDQGGPEGDESAILNKFWKTYREMRDKSRKVVGTNIFGFDLPFLVRRSWILGVEVPSTVRNGRYWDGTFVDIRDVWLLGQSWSGCESSLDHMARVLDVGSKPEGVNGAMFWKLWQDPETKQQAIDYLVNDLTLTWGVCQKIGVV